jgi:hypothetical protein
MNQTIQEAAAAYIKHQDPAEILSLEEGGIVTDAFIAGAEWAALKWIPVTERLPEDQSTPHICMCDDAINNDPPSLIVAFHENGHVFKDFDGTSWRVVKWCPIPHSLLNFKP